MQLDNWADRMSVSTTELLVEGMTYKNALKPAESKCSICTEDAMFVATPKTRQKSLRAGKLSHIPPGSTPLQRMLS